MAGELTTGRGSRPLPDRRGAWGYRFPPEPGAGDGGAGGIASPSERRRRRIRLHTVPGSGHAGGGVHGPSSRPAGGTRDSEGAPRRTNSGGRALVRPSHVERPVGRSNHVRVVVSSLRAYVVQDDRLDAVPSPFSGSRNRCRRSLSPSRSCGTPIHTW